MRVRTKKCMTCGELYLQKGKFTAKCPLCNTVKDDHYIITPIIQNNHPEYRSKSANIDDNDEALESAKRFYALTGYCEHFKQFQEDSIPNENGWSLKIRTCMICGFSYYNN